MKKPTTWKCHQYRQKETQQEPALSSQRTRKGVAQQDIKRLDNHSTPVNTKFKKWPPTPSTPAKAECRA